MVQLVILADDLTGAADTGGAFAQAGWPTRVAFGETTGEDAAVLVRSTESRDLPEAEAAAVNRRAAAALPPVPLVYKKVDSMLRGNPGAELLAVMAGLGESRALVAPALPAQGRTTLDGWQRIKGARPPGIDLMETFGRGQDLPVTRLDLAQVRRGPEFLARAIDEFPTGLLVADAETEDDLAMIAGGVRASGIRLVAGAAGLARHLALTLPGERSVPVAAQWQQSGAILIVAASRHPATAAQVEALRAAGVAVVSPSQAVLDGDDLDLAGISRDLAGHLAQGQPAVLTTCGRAPSRQGAAFVVQVLAGIVASVAPRGLAGGLVLTGGDVAAGVTARLGATEIVLGGEVRPAIPWGMLHAALMPITPVVTKAGSFGDRKALLDCLQFLGNSK